MHHLTAAETQCYLGLVTLGQKANQITQFDLVVRLTRLPGRNLTSLTCMCFCLRFAEWAFLFCSNRNLP